MNTKLAFRPSDIGSMLEWDNAQIIKMIDDPNHSNSTIVEFRVPDVDGEFETISIEYKFTRNEGWRINSLPIVFL
ncbi:hypothetical protein GCM10010913_25570 [Paenibacillus aceti]|uniref:Uncharacterized protein n=2 Tax=Paenibacillus aceti TaxID=1820010 RepID=A0ABQ1VXB3_9BACL|nr:hypothetical protein GCM10010913_25570 [Paenibacillus aceti]